MFAGAIKTTPSVPPVSFRHRAGNCILVTVSVICVCILVACGVLIVREYALDMSYGPSVCVVANITFLKNQYMKCTHCSVKEKNKQKGKGACKETSFPCVHVLVNYSVDGKTVQGRLHPDSLHARGQYKQCSYSVCMKTKEQNEAKVEEFAQEWREKRGNRFECFYNKDEPRSVIQVKNHTKAQVIHSMLWPSLVIIVCGVIFLRLEMNRRHLTFCGVQGDEEFMNKVNKRPNNPQCKNSQTEANDGLLKQGPSYYHGSLEQIQLSSNINSNNATDNRANGSKSLTYLDRVGDSKNVKKSKDNEHKRSIEATLTEGGVSHKVVKSPVSSERLDFVPQIVVDPSSTCS